MIIRKSSKELKELKEKLKQAYIRLNLFKPGDKNYAEGFLRGYFSASSDNMSYGAKEEIDAYIINLLGGKNNGRN